MSSPENSRISSDGWWMVVARSLWIPTAILAVGILFASIPGYFLPLSEDLPTGLIEGDIGSLATVGLALGRLASIGSSMLSVSLAVLVYWKRRTDRMALLVSYFLLIYGVTFAGPGERLELMLTGGTDVTLVATTLLLTIPTVLIFSLFPNGVFVPGWSRWLSLGSLVWLPIYFGVTPITPNPDTLQVTYAVGFIWILVIVIPMFYAQIYRYRQVSTPAERQQTKWVLYGFGLWMTLIFLSSIPYFSWLSQPPGSAIPTSAASLSFVWWLTQAILPISLAIALLRFRLWEIDQIINRSLVYFALSVMLALVYLLSVVVLQVMFRGLTGQESPLAIVISTLAIAALFNPLRHRLQAFVDRRFYRARYDSSRALANLSSGMRERVDLADISQIILTTVDDTLRPEYLSLWLREADYER